MNETQNDLDIEPGVRAAEVASDSRSLLDRIKAARDERPDELQIDIPSWDGDLQAIYRPVDRSEVEKMIRRIRNRQGNGNTGSVADIDFLIRACIGVVAIDVETDKETRLSDGYNADLIRMLQPPNVQENDIRGLVAYMLKGNTLALGAHAMKVARWMQDTSKPIEDPQ